MIDNRLKETKCEKCVYGHYLILEHSIFTECDGCTDRPNRGKDKSRFKPDVETQQMKDFLDKDGRIGSAAEY